MPNVYAIVGERNAGKTTLVRSLTGLFRRKGIEIATHAGDIQIYVYTSSPHESNMDIQTFMNDAVQTGYPNILVPLWVSPRVSPKRNYPAGKYYLYDFTKAGWTISEVVLLGIASTQLPTLCPRPIAIPNSKILPRNRVASLVRTGWGWL